jgi:hypothetical protein
MEVNIDSCPLNSSLEEVEHCCHRHWLDKLDSSEKSSEKVTINEANPHSSFCKKTIIMPSDFQYITVSCKTTKHHVVLPVYLITRFLP